MQDFAKPEQITPPSQPSPYGGRSSQAPASLSKRSVRIKFGGHELWLDGYGALYWPTERLLAVSDLHFEKSTFLALHGSLVPPYDTQETLERLEALVSYYQPQELLLLGDSFHDARAWERLDSYLRERIAALQKQVATIRWIEGNHDVALRGSSLGEFLGQHEVKGILFTHEPEAASDLPQIIGHYHPKVTVLLRNRRLRAPCFAHTENLLVMPAFGSYTGGLDIRHDAFRHATGRAPLSVYLMHQGQVHPLPTRR